MRTDRKKNKGKRTIGIVAGIAVAVLAVVLILVLAGGEAPDNNDVIPGNGIAAVVNGSEITAAEVAAMRTRLYQTQGTWLELEQVLEQLIIERLLYGEAEQAGHVPTVEATERELLVRLALMGLIRDDLEETLEWQGLSYEEYLQRFQRDLAIDAYMSEAIEVSEEEARQFYEDLKEAGDELAPFEEMRSEILFFLTQEKVVFLIEELRDKAEIEYRSSEDAG